MLKQIITQLAPTWLDLEHLAIAAGSIMLVAVILGGIVVWLETVYGPKAELLMQELDEPRVVIRIPRSFLEPAAKGFSGPSVVNIEAHRRRRSFGIAMTSGRTH